MEKYLPKILEKMERLEFETEVKNNLYAYLGKYFEKIKFMDKGEFADKLYEEVKKGNISEAEFKDILKTKILATGITRESKEKVILAIEICLEADKESIDKVYKKAKLIERISGLKYIPIIISKKVEKEIYEYAKERNVLLVYEYICKVYSEDLNVLDIPVYLRK